MEVWYINNSNGLKNYMGVFSCKISPNLPPVRELVMVGDFSPDDLYKAYLIVCGEIFE